MPPRSAAGVSGQGAAAFLWAFCRIKAAQAVQAAELSANS